MSADPKPIDTEWFKSRGFDDKSLKQLAKNAELAERIQKVYTSENVTESSETKSSLIYTWCTLPGQELIDQTETVAKYIFSGKFLNKQQLKLAEGYFTAHKFDFDTAEFEKVTGVGVVITEADIKAHVEKYTTDNLDKLKKADYRVNYPEFLNGLKDSLPLANPSDILKAATEYVKEKFAAELKEASDPKKKDKKKEETAEAKPEGEDEFAEFQKVDLSKLLARDLADAMNDAETLAKHKAATGGKVITRFPPEPNGILHIGHSRAIRFNFSISGLYKGECNLRYDDTNPEKEKKEYMDMIEDNVKWMGFQPTQILHASQYFDQIYDWTVELIKKGKAYICKLPVDVMRKL